MTNNQLFFSLCAVMLTLAGLGKYYIDAKIDPVRDQVNRLIDYMMLHEGKIATLEERTKKL